MAGSVRPAGRALAPGAGGAFGPFGHFSFAQNLLLLLVLLGGGAGGYYAFNTIYDSQKSTTVAAQPTPVLRTTIRNTVAATGSVTATDTASLAFQQGGRIVSINVKSGDHVEAGQAIASEDSSALRLTRDTSQSQVTTAEAKLEALLAGATPDVVAAVRQALATAQAQLSSAVNGIATANNNIASANTDVSTAVNGIAAADNGVASSDNGVLTADNAITTARSTLGKAQNDLATLLSGPLPTDIQTVKAGLDKAQSDLNTAQANYDKLVGHSDLATRPETTAVATARQNYQTALASFQSKTTPPISADVITAQTNLKLARDSLQVAQLKNLQVQADPTAAVADKAAAENQVSAAQAAVDTAQSNLAKLQQGTDEADIAAARAQLDSARTSLASAQRSYDNLVGLTDLSTRPETTALTQARSAYEQALASYNAKLAPPRDTDVGSAQAAVTAAQAGADTAVVAANNARVTANNARVTSSTARVAADKAAISVANAGVAANTAQSNVPSAQAGVEASQAKLSQTVAGALPTDITQATEAVTQARLAMQVAQLAVDNATLKAPFAGTITSTPAHVGDQAIGTTIVATIVNPGSLEIDANVDETAVTQLKAGQSATVTFDAIPGSSFQGSVAVVTPSGTTQSGVVVFPVILRIDTRGQSIPAGISATIQVVTATTPNVLAVRSRDIRRQGASQVVDLLVSGKRQTRVITTGVTNGALTEVKSGLQERDLVLPPLQQSRSGGSTFGAGGVGGAPAPGR